MGTPAAEVDQHGHEQGRGKYDELDGSPMPPRRHGGPHDYHDVGHDHEDGMPVMNRAIVQRYLIDSYRVLLTRVHRAW